MTGNLSTRAGTAGEVGLATESGVLAAAAGGAVEGGLAGAASGAASYTTLAALGETGGWDWGDFAGSTFGGLGRVAAVVSDVRAVLDANGSAVQASDGSDSVIRVSTANSYDKYGRVLSSYAFDPTVPAGADSLRMLWSDTKYDLGGKVVSTTRNSYGLSFAGIVFRSVTERYTYDRLGRVDNIYSSQGYGNAPLAHYEYYPTGSVKSVNLGNSLTLAYTYHISGAVKTATVTSIGGDQLYSETLNYEDCGNGECTPQYNGNISRMAHQLAHGNTAYSENRNVTYYYDQLNRLASAEDIVENAFDEMFEYDAQGRIVSQRRAGNTSNTSGGEYAYESGSNRLKSVAAGMGGTAGSRDMSDADNFVYDQDGNLVEDKSKSLTISYDWRDLPVEFTRETCTDYSGYVFCDSTKLIMAYDGAGRRISKTRMKKTAFDGPWYASLVTHYTGIGTEIRENPVNHETKVVVNMPQGLGRYEPEDAAVLPSSSTSRTFEWYLKNHLGSTMLVYASGYGTPGVVRAAYDYRAFGEQVTLTESADKVTENFTGKEKDDETELNYFGARYLDPMLGVWTSVDPMRQFASPYLYAGNGYNPITGQDDDGGYYNDENGKAIYETAKKNDSYGNPIVKETLEWGANSPNPINVTITKKDRFNDGYPVGGDTKNSYSFMSSVLDKLNGCWMPKCSNAFAPDISSSDITIYNGSYNYMQEKGGYSRAGVPIDGMPLEEWLAKTLTHEIEFHIRKDLGQKENSEYLEHKNKVKDAEMWK